MTHDVDAQEGERHAPGGPFDPGGCSAARSPALLLTLAVGCTNAPAKQRARVISCGSARTAANVPIRVEVTSGNLTCATAMSIEHKYAEAIRSGQAPGNGGGGPVKVDGWTCQGYATPVVLHTGKASKCVKDGDQILAILPTS